MSTTAESMSPEITSYLRAWTDSFAAVVGQVAGSSNPFELLDQAPADNPAASAEDPWLIAASSGKLSGELAFRLSSADARRLSQLFVGEPQDGGTELPSEQREALLELLRQVAGYATTNLKSQWGEIPIRLELAPAPTWAAAATAWLGCKLPAPIAVEVRLSAALVASLRASRSESQAFAKPPSDPEKRLGMLLDVELTVMLRFGGRRMLLKDILELGAGSVVELDQQVQEPVELLLDGRLIARGEVVVVDGNYGLRVTELMSNAAN
jgi:flagellar motor switch protein FliN